MSDFAMIFPGQGSQYLGMLANIAKKFKIIEEIFAISSNILGYDLWNLVQNGTNNELNKTWKTQPAILSASVAIFKVWQEKKGKMPKLMAGHSLGEYSALVCANVINFKSAIKLVELRGKFMQESIPEGTGSMYAIIGLDDKIVRELCQKASQGEIVSIVNFNSPNQVVIAGNRNAINRAIILCKVFGAKHILLLPISIPAHCILMQVAAKKLFQVLEEITFNKPSIDVINNVDVKIEKSAHNIRQALVRQMYNPVRWVEIIKFINNCGISKLIEIGPGKILSNLNKQIIKKKYSKTINDTELLITMLMKK